MSNIKIKRPTKTEDAVIRKGIAADKDAAVMTKADLRKMRPAREAFPEIVAAYERGRGRPVGRKKEVVSLSIDKEIAAALRATGNGWQTRVNAVLAAMVGMIEPQPDPRKSGPTRR